LFKAHINGKLMQSCNEHSINTALYSGKNIKSVGLEKSGYLSGLIHDAGKYTNEFTKYLEAAASGEAVAKGSVIHTFAGVRLLLSEFHSLYNGGEKKGDWDDLTSELLAIAVGSHHGQFDVFDDGAISGFEHRMKKQPEYDNKAIENFYSSCTEKNTIKKLFQESAGEIERFALALYEMTKDTEEFLFYSGLLERLISSSVMDGDRRDTAEFMSENTINFEKYSEEKISILWDDSYRNLMNKLNTFSTNTEIARARREMSDYCERFAEKPCGVYRLNLPTGAGKTLSSLRYALVHAKRYNKKRIIFAVPLLSILDQNAEIIREAIGNSDMILEHHSNVIIENESSEEFVNREMLIDTWSAPVIITTLVQLLNTMFAGRTSAIRRFHSLTDSIVVIDEVQSVPEKMISLFNMTLNFLSRTCNTTFVLCSATQPLLELNSHKLLVDDSDFIPAEKLSYYKQIFKRNQAIFEGQMDMDSIFELIRQYRNDYKSVLIICNTKKEAADIYNMIKETMENSYHLSTSMCMAHRKNVLNKVSERLNCEEGVICVSTQLIEAGVDVSFGAVIRISAGIDNIVQAAGRCNRNGERENCAPVSIVSLSGENLTRLKEIKRAQDATGELVAEYKKNPDSFDNDLLSDKAIDYYYKVLFKKLNSIGNYTNFCKKNVQLFDLLACNNKYTPENEEEPIFMRQAFKTAGKYFSVFENEQSSVIVPYKNGEEIINDILSEDFLSDYGNAKKTLHCTKEFSVNLFQYQIEKLKEMNALYTDKNKTVLILNGSYYDDNLGIIFEESEVGKCSTLIL